MWRSLVRAMCVALVVGCAASVLVVSNHRLRETSDVVAAGPVFSGMEPITSMLVSPRGSWRGVRFLDGRYFVSSDNATWTEIPIPAEAREFRPMVLDDGRVLVAAPAGLYRYQAGAWSGPTPTPFGGATMVSDGTNVVAYAVTPASYWGGYATRDLFLSRDGGVSWVKVDGYLPPSVDPASMAMIGDRVYLYGSSTGYQYFENWVFTLTVSTGVLGPAQSVFNRSVGSARVASAPGSTTTVYLSGIDSAGGLSVARSTDGGATWGLVADGVGVPYREEPSGLTWSGLGWQGGQSGVVRMLTDGRLWVSGYAKPSASSLVVYEAAWSPGTGQWEAVRKRTMAVAATTVVVGDTQRVDGVPASEMWRLANNGVLSGDVTAIVGSGADDPWPSRQVISANPVIGPGDEVSVSPSGAWTMIVSSGNPGEILTSKDRKTWQAVRAPNKAVNQWAIGDDGRVFGATRDTASWYSSQGSQWLTVNAGPTESLVTGPNGRLLAARQRWSNLSTNDVYTATNPLGPWTLVTSTSGVSSMAVVNGVAYVWTGSSGQIQTVQLSTLTASWTNVPFDPWVCRDFG